MGEEEVVYRVNDDQRRPVIAVDFDGVIVQNAFPEIGKINNMVIICLEYLHDAGWYIILWTCRGGSDLRDAVLFMYERHIPFDTVNNHAPWHQPEDYGHLPGEYGPCVKITADIYLDDKAIRYGKEGWLAALIREAHQYQLKGGE